MKHTPLNWRNNVPVSTQFDDVYYSIQDGLEETRFVFLRNNGLPQRFSAQASPRFTIIETGFGTGLNFLATVQQWLPHASASHRLHFISIEKYPLSSAAIQKALSQWPELSTLCDVLCAQLPPRLSGWHKLVFPEWNLELSLIYDDVFDALNAIHASDVRANAIYLDGFAPAKNPDMWRDEVLQLLGRCANTDATLATFTAVGRVRRSLAQAGFNMQKTPGFGQKREMLIGRYTAPTHSSSQWFHSRALKPQRVAIVGAGIAGSHCASRLAKAGILVDVYEQADSIASGASGNSQGVLFVKLSAGDGDLAEFCLHSYLHATRYYATLPLADNTQNSGMLHLCDDNTWQTLKTRFEAHDDWFKFIDADEASEIAGTAIPQACIWFPQGRWLAPKTLCQHLLEHPNITVHTQTTVQSLTKASQDEHGWQLHLNTGLATADAVVLANSISAGTLLTDVKLPLRPAAGQISIASNTPKIPLKTIVCGKGYAVPATGEHYTFGASYRMNVDSQDVLDADHKHNMTLFTASLPMLPPPTIVGGRTSTRAASNDYLPLVGPAPDTQQFIQTFAELQHNAKAHIAANGPTHAGLYVFCGFGSRGLSYTPFCADILCDHIIGNGIQHHAKWTQLLHPSRFLIRALKRNTLDDLV